MKLTEVLLGSPNLGRDRSLDHLVSEGFSREEAVTLAWLRRRMDLGQYLGLGAGLLLLASVRKGRLMPLPLFSRPVSTRLVAGVLAGGLLAGNFLFNGNRRAGNTPIGNLYSNNNLIANKLDLVQNYEPFNRKFTRPEVEQMLFNDRLKTLGRKKYIYNPNVHGADEAAFKAKHELFNSGKHEITPDILSEVDLLNASKKAIGEPIVLKPFKISEHLDIHGSKEHIHKFEVLSKRHVL